MFTYGCLSSELIDCGNRLAIIEEDNRRLEKELAEVSNKTKLAEAEEAKLAEENTSVFANLRSGHRRVPG